MITAEEIADVVVFSQLAQEDRERLARAAADIWLEPGEYAAQEGDAQALFGLLEGEIEAVKLQDGVERIVGARAPGDLFGEVPIVLGTGFPVGFRAAVRSRVLRIQPSDYHTLVAAAPAVAQRVGELAAYRMTGAAGLQGLAAQPPPPRAIVAGERWDASCTDLRRFLDRNQISFKWVTADAADAEEL